MIGIKDTMNLMNRAVRRAKDTLQYEGNLYPTVIFYKKGKSLDIDSKDIEKYKGIVYSLNSNEQDLPVSDDFTAEDGEEINTHFILFRYDDKFNESYIDKATRYLTKKYQPDMVGLVMACLYVEPNKNNMDIQINPDATKLLHSVYFSSNSSNGRTIFIPYISRGKFPINEQHYIGDEVTGETAKYDMIFVDSAWVPTKFVDIRPSISNPYKGR